MLLFINDNVQVRLADEGNIGISDGTVVLRSKAACEQTVATLPFCFIGEQVHISALTSDEVKVAVETQLAAEGWDQVPTRVLLAVDAEHDNRVQ